MATLTDIETAINNVIRYQGANGPVDRRAVNVVFEVLSGTLKALDSADESNAVRLFRPTDEQGRSRPVGEYVQASKAGYASGLRITVGQFSVDVLFYMVVREAPGLPIAEHQAWCLKTDDSAEFDFGIDLNNDVGKVAAYDAITNEVKGRLINAVEDSLKLPPAPYQPPPLQMSRGGSLRGGGGRGY